MPKISVVLPVYNGANYLAETLTSLSEQTFQDFEIVAIDDGSSDNSLALLEAAAVSDKRLKLLQKPNGGSAVRCIIFALPHCQGDYFFYCSQDDLLSRDCLQAMIEKAEASNADAVVPNMEWYHEDATKTKSILPPNHDYDSALNGKEAFTLSLNWQIHGFSLRKMSLVREVGYDDQYANSDEYITRLFYSRCASVAFCKGVFRYRQDNANAMTKKFSPITFDWLATELRVLELAKNLEIPRSRLKEQARQAVKMLRKKCKLLNENAEALSEQQHGDALMLIESCYKTLLDFLKANKLPLLSIKTKRIGVRYKLAGG